STARAGARRARPATARRTPWQAARPGAAPRRGRTRASACPRTTSARAARCRARSRRGRAGRARRGSRPAAARRAPRTPARGGARPQLDGRAALELGERLDELAAELAEQPVRLAVVGGRAPHLGSELVLAAGVEPPLVLGVDARADLAQEAQEPLPGLALERL